MAAEIRFISALACHGYAGFEPADNTQVMRAALRVGRQREVDIRLLHHAPFREAEVIGKNARQRVGLAIEYECAALRLAVAAETLHPEPVAEHRGPRGGIQRAHQG